MAVGSISDGGVWVGFSNGNVMKYDRSGNQVHMVQGFSTPSSLTVTPNGGALVVDSGAGTLTINAGAPSVSSVIHAFLTLLKYGSTILLYSRSPSGYEGAPFLFAKEAFITNLI